MKRTQKLTDNIQLLVISLLIISSNIFAQQRGQQNEPPRTPDITGLVDELGSKLSLSSDQKSTVKDLFISHFEEVEGLMKSDRGERDAMHTKMQKLKSNLDNAIIALLNDDQIEAFKELQKNQNKQRNNRQPRNQRPQR
ncbi:MAG: hypothetical protein JEY94_13640 [Melioribacteraceae bacterium]|nr:hypothetical protein [Melioribacteraceae bacterium]